MLNSTRLRPLSEVSAMPTKVAMQTRLQNVDALRGLVMVIMLGRVARRPRRSEPLARLRLARHPRPFRQSLVPAARWHVLPRQGFGPLIENHRGAKAVGLDC